MGFPPEREQAFSSCGPRTAPSSSVASKPGSRMPGSFSEARTRAAIPIARPRQSHTRMGYQPRLHVRIVRASRPFRHDPVDVLGHVLDVAGLAVHAVLRV